MIAVVVDGRVKEVHFDVCDAELGAKHYVKFGGGPVVEVVECPEWVYHEFGGGGEIILKHYPLGVSAFEKQVIEVHSAESKAMDELFDLLINGKPDQPR